VALGSVLLSSVGASKSVGVNAANYQNYRDAADQILFSDE
jgi:hypothetical protein